MADHDVEQAADRDDNAGHPLRVAPRAADQDGMGRAAAAARYAVLIHDEAGCNCDRILAAVEAAAPVINAATAERDAALVEQMGRDYPSPDGFGLMTGQTAKGAYTAAAQAIRAAAGLPTATPEEATGE